MIFSGWGVDRLYAIVTLNTNGAVQMTAGQHEMLPLVVLALLALLLLLLMLDHPNGRAAPTIQGASFVSGAATSSSSGAVATNQNAVQAKLLRATHADIAAGKCWWYSPAASAEETRIIHDARELLSDLHPPLHFNIRLLRLLRAQPREKQTAEQVARVYRNVHSWRSTNVAYMVPEVHLVQRADAAADAAAETTADEDSRSGGHPAGGSGIHGGHAEAPSVGRAAGRCAWPSVRDLPHGEWGAVHAQIGLRCGRTLQGMMPVKIERMGTHDANSAFERPNGEVYMRNFYYDILESGQHSLNAESEAVGVMMRSYDIFDMAGLSLAQLSLPTMQIAKVLLGVFASIYAETTGRSVIINLPWALRVPVMGPIKVLPQRVQVKVAVLGDNWREVLAQELDEDAMRLLGDPHVDLTAHRGAVLLDAERVLRSA